MDLAIPREKFLFKINCVFAAIFWLALIGGTFGIGLIYVFGAFIFYLFVHSALISHLKGNAVQISRDQFHDLYNKIDKACEKLNMNAPNAYVMNGNGIVNAFAAKFLGRYYLVLFSDVLDAFQGEDGSIDFYIGHELGHIQRDHMFWWPFLLPASILPILMPAYRRACESTCDQYGKFVSSSSEDAIRGLSLLAAGNTRWKSMSPAKYMEQISESGGFWMSFHELTASYPWLSKRVAMVQNGPVAKDNFPKRHWGAWVLALFCPGFLSGALFPILIIYALIIGAVVAVPAFQRNYLKAKTVQTETAVPQDNHWRHPVTGASIQLPDGFSNISVSTKSDLVVGTFSNNPDMMLEQLLAEKMTTKLDFPTYAKALRESKAKMLGEALPLTQIKMRKVGGLDVAEFMFSNTAGGVTFENVIRAWSSDGIYFWHVISTIRADSEQAHKDSERFLEFLIANTK